MNATQKSRIKILRVAIFFFESMKSDISNPTSDSERPEPYKKKKPSSAGKFRSSHMVASAGNGQGVKRFATGKLERNTSSIFIVSMCTWVS